ncbi:hypothetical protein LCGC14_0220510 [marine sediment metagenome]|uniref:Uncharacterized protein n=1 Tax=marine sediment metagenome TaxID=412755 RepID=A0A0F9UDC2_9ZZZZ
MQTKPCKCCEDKKSGASGGAVGYGFNRLEGEARKWATENQFARSEHCIPVKGGTRFCGPDWQKIKCGDGRMGFSTRRKGQNEVHIVVGLDGEFKKRSGTLVRPRSARASASRWARRVDGSKCGLVSSEVIVVAQRDPIVVAQAEKAYKQMVRKEKFRGINHNKARRAAKRNRRAQLRMVA